jgi:hypothetical protein
MGWECSLENMLHLDIWRPNMMSILILPQGIADLRLVSKTFLEINPLLYIIQNPALP